MRKGTFWELRKGSTLVSRRIPCSLTMVEAFRYLQIFCVLIDNSTILNGHFEIIEPYRPVLTSFLSFYLGVLIRPILAVRVTIFLSLKNQADLNIENLPMYKVSTVLQINILPFFTKIPHIFLL